MLFRKSNRRRRMDKQSSEIPSVESVEDRLMLSAGSLMTPDVAESRVVAPPDSALDTADSFNEGDGHRRWRHDHHRPHHGPVRMRIDDNSTTATGDADTLDSTDEAGIVDDGVVDSNSVAVADAEMIPTSVDATDIDNLDAGDAIVAESDVVLEWNDLFGELLAADQVTQNPGYASRSMAILNLAIYDAVQLAEGNFGSTFYEYGSEIIDLVSGVFPEVAAAQAAYTALSSLYPDQQATIDAFAVGSFGAYASNADNDASIALGIEVGNRIIAERADDGSTVSSVYEYTDEVGYFAADPLNPDVPAWGPTWGEVDTFAISSSDDFLPETTPALTSEEYAASYNEVLELGAADSDVRTAEQTEIGIFWGYDRAGLGTPIALFNDILQTVAIQEGNTFEENAALFAQASVALADAGVTAWDTKFTEEFWRPVTAIHEGDADGNDLTEGDTEWVALGAPDGGDDEIGFTPQFPTYISGHATFGAALFGTLQDFYGTDDIAFDVTSTELEILLDNPELQEAYGLDLDDATRSFSSFSEAMAENGRSRVYLGIHFDFDDLVGQEVGQAVAASVAEKFASLAGESGDSATAYVDLAEVGSGNVTVRAVDGNLEVIDNRTRTVVSSQSLAETDRVTVVGRVGQSDRIVVEGLTAADLPGGISIESGNDAGDTLVVSGTKNADTITVNNENIDVNGLNIEVTGVRRVIVQGTDSVDTVEVADDVSFRVNVINGTKGHDTVADGRRDGRQEDRRGRQDQPDERRNAAADRRDRSTTGPQRTRVEKGPASIITAAPSAASPKHLKIEASAAAKPGKVIETGSVKNDEADSSAALDRFFASKGLGEVLGQPGNGQRRR